MKEIYIVEGRCGVYEDKCEWPVKAFASKQKAEEFAKSCLKIAEEGCLKYGSWQNLRFDGIYNFNENNEPKWQHPLDKFFQTDTDGTEYSVYSVLYDESEE